MFCTGLRGFCSLKFLPSLETPAKMRRACHWGDKADRQLNYLGQGEFACLDNWKWGSQLAFRIPGIIMSIIIVRTRCFPVPVSTKIDDENCVRNKCYEMCSLEQANVSYCGDKLYRTVWITETKQPLCLHGEWMMTRCASAGKSEHEHSLLASGKIALAVIAFERSFAV